MNNNDQMKINGIGFAIGVERIYEIIKHNWTNQQESKNNIDVFFALENDEQYQVARKTIYNLRSDNVSVEYNLKKRKFKKLWEEAHKLKPHLIIFQELNQHNSDLWTIKNGTNNIIVAEKELEFKIKEILLTLG